MDTVEQLLTTVVTNQEDLMSRTTKIETHIESISKSLSKILVIEERQLNYKEAQTRMGHHIDRLDEEVAQIKDRLHNMKIAAAVTNVKITIISAVSALVVSAIVAAIVNSVVK